MLPSLPRTEMPLARDFHPPYPVRFKGNALARWVLGAAGWRVLYEGLPARQGVVVVYPHTSNWDFVVGILAKWSVGLPFQFWGKDTLFSVPLLGAWIRWLGGIPVVRTGGHGVVDAAVSQFKLAKQHDQFMWVALAPEGTRRKAEGWRTGFYQTVLKAELPLGLVHLDFKTKTVRVLEFITLSGDEQKDFARLALAFANAEGYHPSNVSPVAPRSKRTAKEITPK
jgi:1-acyl-sn-glycerol-3-phosphate acyltransferase